MTKIYTGKLYGIAPLFKKDKKNEKLVLRILEEAYSEYPTLKMALGEMTKKNLDTKDLVLLFNQFESLVLEWKKKWISIEYKGRI